MKILFLLFLFSLSNCSHESKKNENNDKNDNQIVDQTGNNGENNSVTDSLKYGYVGLCVKNVTKTGEMDQYIRLNYFVECSPMIEAKDETELKLKLKNWTDSNCPKSINLANEEACEFLPTNPVFVTSTDKLINTNDHCQVKVGKQYGSLGNKSGFNCMKKIGLF